MGRITKSAKGKTVDFDLLEIQQALATAPITTIVDQRRQFIDSKLSGKTLQPVSTEIDKIVEVENVPAALMVAAEAVKISASSKKNQGEKTDGSAPTA